MSNNNAVGSKILLRFFLAVLLAVSGLASCGGGGESTATTNTPPAIPAVSVSASPSSIAYGATSVIAWTSTDSTSCTSTGGGGTGTTGSFTTPALTASTTYTVSCMGPGGTASQSTTITVGATAPVVILTATPSSIAYGAISIINWASTDSTSCTSSGGGGTGTTGSFTTPALTASTTYTVSCTGPGGTANQSVTVSVAGSACPTVTYNAPSGTANNIVFTFDKPYLCGQFANGDWWVSPDSAGGTVHVVSITPDGIAGKHGVEINPSSTTEQAFDNQAEVPYNGSLLAAIPGNVPGGSSIVKAVSILPNPSSRPALQFAAVLTVLDTPLANSGQYFRPSYFGATKTFYPVSDVNLTVLPKRAASAITGFDKPNILPPSGAYVKNLLDRYTGVRLDHIGAWTGRDIHPKDAMPDYGAQIATDNAVYLLRMAIDDFDPASNGQHTLALVNYLQTAIDLQAMAVNGTKWNATGGHSIGRKLPLAFAAKAFTTPSIKAAFSSAISTAAFDEDLLLYRSTINNKVLYGQSGSDFQYWQSTLNGGATGAKDVRDPYGLIDGGGDQVGAGGYQFCCTSLPWKYTALAIYVLNLQSEFNSPNLLEYAERWVNWGVITLADTCAPFDGITAVHPSLPANYNVTYGSISPGVTPYSCISGAGRWPLRDGAQKNDGSYKSFYGDSLWVWYKAQPGAISVPYTH